jgi:hypothetical protein
VELIQPKFLDLTHATVYHSAQTPCHFLNSSPLFPLPLIQFLFELQMTWMISAASRLAERAPTRCLLKSPSSAYCEEGGSDGRHSMYHDHYYHDLRYHYDDHHRSHFYATFPPYLLRNHHLQLTLPMPFSPSHFHHSLLQMPDILISSTIAALTRHPCV